MVIKKEQLKQPMWAFWASNFKKEVGNDSSDLYVKYCSLNLAMRKECHYLVGHHVELG